MSATAQNPVTVELERRWREIFTALDEGFDVPPAQCLRAEGMMESLVLMELATADELRERMAAIFELVSGSALPQHFLELHPFPQIPVYGRRAPVYPS